MGNHPGSIIDKLKDRISGKRLPWKSSSPTINWIRLREILTSLITFDKVETCEQWLKKCLCDEKLILIVSGAYGEEILPKTHHSHLFVKSSTDELLQELSQNQSNLESIEDSKALQIYQHEQQISSLDNKTASFISTFIELIQILRQYSFNDEYRSKLIHEFEQTYNPKRAVSWLIRDTPLTRFVSEQDINMLFTLRFLLIDTYTQLTENQAQSLNVFKIQLMLKSEI